MCQKVLRLMSRELQNDLKQRAHEDEKIVDPPAKFSSESNISSFEGKVNFIKKASGFI